MADEWMLEDSFGRSSTSTQMHSVSTTARAPFRDSVAHSSSRVDDGDASQKPHLHGQTAEDIEMQRWLDADASQQLATFDTVPRSSPDQPSTIDPALLQLSNPLSSLTHNVFEAAEQSQPFEGDTHHVEQQKENVEAPHHHYYEQIDPLFVQEPFGDFDLLDLTQQHLISETEEETVLDHAATLSNSINDLHQQAQGLIPPRAIVGDAAAERELRKLLDNGLILGGTAGSFFEAVKQAVASLQRSGDFPGGDWCDQMIHQIESDGEDDMKTFIEAVSRKYNHDNQIHKPPVSYGVLMYYHGLPRQQDRIELYSIRDQAPTHCFCLELWPGDGEISDPIDGQHHNENFAAHTTSSSRMNANPIMPSSPRYTRTGNRRVEVERPNIKPPHRTLQHIGMPDVYWRDKTPYAVRDLIVAGTISPDQVTGEIAFRLAQGYSNIDCAGLIGIARDTFYNGRLLKFMHALSKEKDAPPLGEIMQALDQARRANSIRVGHR